MGTEHLGKLRLFFADAEGPPLGNDQDALDLLGETYGQEIDVIVVPVARFALQFFQLRTQLAGGFFQKFQNYRMRLAIMGDISAHISGSKALQDFVTETNRKGHHLFAADRADLETRLLR